MTRVEILIPSRRPSSLAVTLVSLYYQEFGDFEITIADQGERDGEGEALVEAARRLHQFSGRKVQLYRNWPRKGITQNREFLLQRAKAPRVLFLDDDVVLEPWAVGTMVGILEREGCGFVGMGLVGLSYVDDVRLSEQRVEWWEGRVKPERVTPGSPEWERYKLHSAANLYHVAEAWHLSPETPKTYKVAWVGGCVLYDREKLEAVGGFRFWKDLHPEASGEDVWVQLQVMAKYGGCGVLPSGAYHQELVTTLPERAVNAPVVLGERLRVKSNDQ